MYVMLQHAQPCRIEYTITSQRRVVIYSIQHGRYVLDTYNVCSIQHRRKCGSKSIHMQGYYKHVVESET
jgi:hypothetical protein